MTGLGPLLNESQFFKQVACGSPSESHQYSGGCIAYASGNRAEIGSFFTRQLRTMLREYDCQAGVPDAPQTLTRMH